MPTVSNVYYKKALLTANGGADGLLTVADTTGFIEGALIYLNATGLPTVELIIDEIVDGTKLYAKVNVPYIYYRYAANLYTTALDASITQPQVSAIVNGR